MVRDDKLRVLQVVLVHVFFHSLRSACPSTRKPGSTVEPQVSDSGSCNGNQTSFGCATDPGVGGVSVDFLVGGYKLCVKRGGLPAASRKSDVTASKGCEGGLVRCGGAGTWDTTRVTCQPSLADCPILSLTYGPYSGAGTSDIIPLGSSNALFLSRSVLAGNISSNAVASPVGPLVNFDVGYNGRQCFGDNSPEGYSNKGSPRFSTSGQYEAGSLASGGSCDKTDPRYFPVVGVFENTLLNDAFPNATQCNAANSANTLAGAGVPDFTGTCGNTDGRCQAITGTSICDKLKAYLPPPSTTNKLVAIERPEIFWSADCELSRECAAAVAQHSTNPPPLCAHSLLSLVCRPRRHQESQPHRRCTRQAECAAHLEYPLQRPVRLHHSHPAGVQRRVRGRAVCALRRPG